MKIALLLVGIAALIFILRPQPTDHYEPTVNGPQESGPRSDPMLGVPARPDASLTVGSVPKMLSQSLVAFPRVEVKVVDSNGSPVADGVVYATSADGPGSDDLEDLPRARTDRAGIAKLYVPVPGAYDVAARTNDGEASHCRVDVLRGTPSAVTLALVMRATCTLRFREGSQPITTVAIREAGDSVRRVWPGRHEMRKERMQVSAPRVPDQTEIQLFPGRSYRINASYSDLFLRADPTVLVAPGSVEVSRPWPYAVRVRPRLRSSHGMLDKQSLVTLRIWLEREPSKIHEVVPLLGIGTSPQLTQLKPVLLLLDEPAGTVCWSGPGLAEGCTSFRALPRRRVSELVIEPEVVDLIVPAEGPIARSRLVTVETSIKDIEPTASFSILVDAPVRKSYEHSWRELVEGEGREHLRNGAHLKIVDESGSIASAVHRVHSDNEIRVPLRPTGIARIVPTTAALGALGRVRVRATNGEPLCVRVEGGWNLRDSIEIDRVRDIGGVLPGTMALKVEVGGAPIGMIAVPIQAGKTSVFRLDE